MGLEGETATYFKNAYDQLDDCKIQEDDNEQVLNQMVVWALLAFATARNGTTPLSSSTTTATATITLTPMVRYEQPETLHEIDTSSDPAYASDSMASTLSPGSTASSDDSGEPAAFAEATPADSGHKTVLVTGGAGFVGGAVAEALLARGDDVLIVDEVNDYYDVRVKRASLAALVARYGAARVRIFEGDVADAAFMGALFAAHAPQWIVHMAARAGVRPSIQDPFVYVHSNVLGTTRLLELAARHGCRSFAFASSSSVYGEGAAEVFSEDDAVDAPVSPYAATKKACELMAHTYAHLYGLNVAALRFFTVYGPRGRPDMAPYKFIAAVCAGREIQQYGDGSTSRDYTYIEDIVDGVVRALDRPLGYQVYNLGRGEPTRLSRFIGIVERCVGRAAVIRVCPEQPGDVPRTCADISKARRLLGYEPRVSFEEGIARTVAWYKETYMAEEGLPQQPQQQQEVEQQAAAAAATALMTAAAAKAQALTALPPAAVVVVEPHAPTAMVL
ncbi:hypothetical protein JKP88DRAFT_348460 [Tribonema minus]|uniref:NAD(P)-binding domain-containing protein n=1 Tax=Tribonema minus TaxID=303371 RepID=A0A835Z3G0_9STRA|nr:hypothetical protein JKP88DRAFT_348460 [Tribonema minus]